jgi:3-oxosteroid 1-dehydrogenase
MEIVTDRKIDATSDNYDFVIVGSGAASVVAALVAAEAGYKPIILEKTDKFGGSTGYSGGVVWLPDNPIMRRLGIKDSYASGRTYLDACVGDVGPASSPARRETYIKEGTKAVTFLEQKGMKFYHSWWPDYHVDQLPEGLVEGRSFEAKMFNLNRLKSWRDALRILPSDLVYPIKTPEVRYVGLNGRTWKGKITFAMVGARAMLNRLGQKWVARGGAFQGRLLKIALDNKIPIELNSSVMSLVTSGGRVAGVEITRNGVHRKITAKRGVLINAGGFSHNLGMRQKHQGPGTTTEFTHSNPGDTGELIQMAEGVGAATALMDQSWWTPSTQLPDGTLLFASLDIGKPHCIMVDSSGQRYVNEATSYVTVGNAMYERDKTIPALPSWLVFDSVNRDSYRWAGTVLPGAAPEELVEKGYFIRGQTLEELGRQCSMNVDTFVKTIQRFNGFVDKGVDEDFGRGASRYERFWGDPTVTEDGTLGTIAKPPFYAVKIYAADVGTCGGLLADEFARVLRADGTPIEGLYAAGNSAASVMGRAYPGAGASIGPSLVFGYVAAKHATGVTS